MAQITVWVLKHYGEEKDFLGMWEISLSEGQKIILPGKQFNIQTEWYLLFYSPFSPQICNKMSHVNCNLRQFSRESGVWFLSRWCSVNVCAESCFPPARVREPSALWGPVQPWPPPLHGRTEGWCRRHKDCWSLIFLSGRQPAWRYEITILQREQKVSKVNTLHLSTWTGTMCICYPEFFTDLWSQVQVTTFQIKKNDPRWWKFQWFLYSPVFVTEEIIAYILVNITQWRTGKTGQKTTSVSVTFHQIQCASLWATVYESLSLFYNFYLEPSQRWKGWE